MAVLHLLFRAWSATQLYGEWVGRGGLLPLHTTGTAPRTEQGGSVRSGSVLAHFPAPPPPRPRPAHTLNTHGAQDRETIVTPDTTP